MSSDNPSHHSPTGHDHADEATQLLAALALGDLSPDEHDGAARAAIESPELAGELELAAAALTAALCGGGEDSAEAMPSYLSSRIENALLRDAESPGSRSGERTSAAEATPAPLPMAQVEARQRSALPPSGRNESGIAGMLGWFAAAAAIALAAVGWLRPTPEPGQRVVEGSTLPASQAKLTLERDRLTSQPGTVALDWGVWVKEIFNDAEPALPYAAAVEGGVVWNTARQEGYMTFKGLPVNDPSNEQYQLWIVTAGHAHPVDGGVFDVSEAGEVVVKIDPKLRVEGIGAFGVTVERPGGVVVSDRDRRVVAAAAPSGL